MINKNSCENFACFLQNWTWTLAMSIIGWPPPFICENKVQKLFANYLMEIEIDGDTDTIKKMLKKTGATEINEKEND